MKVALCLSGLEPADFTRRALEKLPAAVEFTLLYVVDTRPAEELNFMRRTHLFGSRTGSQHRHDMRTADQDLGSQILAEAAAQIENYQGGQHQIEAQLIFEGRPEREIIAYLDRSPVDLVVIGTRFQGDLKASAPPPPPPPRPGPEPLPPLEPRAGRGPQSIPPIARFIIDHALCDILILK